MFTKPRRKVITTFLHCSASDHAHHDNIATMRKWHMDKGWSDVGYHFFIRKDGTLEAGRSLEKTPAAQRGHNTYSVAICLHGLKEAKFTDAQFETLKKLCIEIHEAYGGNMTFRGHREVSSKACPVFDYKDVLQLDSLGSLGIAGSPSDDIDDTDDADPNKMPILKVGSRGKAVAIMQRLLLIKDDGLFGPKTASAVRAFKILNGLDGKAVVDAPVWAALFDAEQIEHLD